MNKLERARKSIDRIDKKAARLFEKRMAKVLEISDYKSENGLPVEDKAREESICKNCAEWINKDCLPYYTEVLKTVVEQSKKYQNDIKKG